MALRGKLKNEPTWRRSQYPGGANDHRELKHMKSYLKSGDMAEMLAPRCFVVGERVRDLKWNNSQGHEHSYLQGTTET